MEHVAQVRLVVAPSNKRKTQPAEDGQLAELLQFIEDGDDGDVELVRPGSFHTGGGSIAVAAV